jgi:hypothetical protein
MGAKTAARQRATATGPRDEINDTPKVTASTDTRHAVELRRHPGCCPRCGAPLDAERVVRRSWRLIRSGEYIGGTGEYRTYRCPCGATRRELHAVWMPRYRGRAA